MTITIGIVLVLLAAFIAYCLYSNAPVMLAESDTDLPKRCTDTVGRLQQLQTSGRWHEVQIEGIHSELGRLEAMLTWHNEQQEAECVECCELLGVDPFRASHARDLCKSIIEGSDPGEVIERVERSRG